MKLSRRPTAWEPTSLLVLSIIFVGENICFVDNWAIEQSTALFPKDFQAIGNNWTEINGTLEIMKNEVCSILAKHCCICRLIFLSPFYIVCWFPAHNKYWKIHATRNPHFCKGKEEGDMIVVYSRHDALMLIL